VRLHRVKLLNFRQHAETEIVLGDGITAVIGPNGAGKTTLLEAIAWAFYGAPAARGSRDSLRWNRAPARSAVRVEVDFSLGPHEYRAVRTLYGAELYLDRGDAPLANSQQEVTAAIQRLLGMTREEFFNTYFTGQKDLAVMAAMGPTERGKFLSRVLGYEKLKAAQDRLREHRSVLRGELQGLERGLGDPAELETERTTAMERRTAAALGREAAEAAHGHAVGRRDQEGPAWTEMVKRRESVLSLDGERRLAEQRVEEARRDFERLDREMAEALTARTRLDELKPRLDEVAPLREELERLEREAQAAGRRRSLSGQLEELGRQARRQEERRTTLAAAPGELDRARSAYDAARQALADRQAEEERMRTEWVRARQEAETRRASLADQYRDLQTHRESIVTAGPDGVCPTCKRTLEEEYEGVLATLGRQLEEIEINGKYFRQRIQQLADEPDEVRAAHEAVQAAERAADEASEVLGTARARGRELTDVEQELARLTERIRETEHAIASLPEQYDAERHEVVRTQLKALDPVVGRAAEYRVKAARAEQLVQEAEGAERLLSEREATVRSLTEVIADLGFSEERFAEARERYERAEAGVREAELVLEGRKGDLRAAEEALATVERRVRERAARAVRADELRRDLHLHDELDRAYQDLRGELNAQLRPELSDLASEFLSDLTDGRYHELELDEQYRLLVLEDGEPKPVISGGEEDIAHLVLRLAISQMVAERAGQPLSLLVLDEIFGSLDESRRQHVVGLLRRLGDRFPQVVLITHIESVRDSVDRVLRVQLDPGRGAAVVSEDTGGRDEDVAA